MTDDRRTLPSVERLLLEPGIAALLEVNPPTSQKDLADDAGVSPEWIRRLAKRAH